MNRFKIPKTKRILTPLLPPEETGDNKSEEQTTFTESEQNKEHTNDDDNAQTTEQTDTVVENSTYESNESQDNADDSVIITLVENFPDVIVIQDGANITHKEASCNTYVEISRPLSTSSESDISVIQQTVSMICPYTKQLMVEPVRNKICGHSYDKAAIQEYIKGSVFARCPVVGCSNDTRLKLLHLEPHKELKNRIDDNNNIK